MVIDNCLTCSVWAQLISESKLLLKMKPAPPLRFGKVLSDNASRVPDARRSHQSLARSSQQPLARSSQQPLKPRRCSQNRTFFRSSSNSGGTRPRKLNLLQKGRQTPTFTMFPTRAAQKVAARKPSSQIQARTTSRLAKTSSQAARIEAKRSQPLAQKPGVAQKRKASPLTPAGRQFRKVFNGSVSETRLQKVLHPLRNANASEG